MATPGRYFHGTLPPLLPVPLKTALHTIQSRGSRAVGSNPSAVSKHRSPLGTLSLYCLCIIHPSSSRTQNTSAGSLLRLPHFPQATPPRAAPAGFSSPSSLPCSLALLFSCWLMIISVLGAENTQPPSLGPLSPTVAAPHSEVVSVGALNA